MGKILITTSSFGIHAPWLLTKIEENDLDVICNPFKRKLKEEEVFELVDQHQPVAIIAGIEPLTRKVLQHCVNLKVISRCGIGIDSVDLSTAKDLGIVVTNTPDAPTTAVAELTIGMILTLLRKLHTSDASIRDGGWARPMGSLLAGKTVGLIGCGRVGTQVAQLLSAFGCEILGCDPVCQNNNHVCLLEADILIPRSHIVSLHIPHNPDTHHFMNQKRIQLMQKGAILINTARGGLIDEKSLLNALQDNHLAGAALDTFEEEPYTGPLKSLSNVLLTAHLGSYALEARVVMEEQAVANMLNILKATGEGP